MASVVVTVAAEEVRLLESCSSAPESGVIADEEIVPLPVEHPPANTAAEDEPKAAGQPKQRLASLDVFRGLTVAVWCLPLFPADLLLPSRC